MHLLQSFLLPSSHAQTAPLMQSNKNIHRMLHGKNYQIYQPSLATPQFTAVSALLTKFLLNALKSGMLATLVKINQVSNSYQHISENLSKNALYTPHKMHKSSINLIACQQNLPCKRQILFCLKTIACLVPIYVQIQLGRKFTEPNWPTHILDLSSHQPLF